MIEYEKRNWSSHLFDIEGSMVREIMGRVMLCVVWSVAVVLVHRLWPHLNIATTPHTLVGLALGLLLVFRTNSSYDRYWEGRRQWGNITNESRNLGRTVSVYLKEDPELASWILSWTAAFPNTVMHSLRGGSGLGRASERLPHDEVGRTLGSENVPLAVSVRMTAGLSTARERGLISDIVLTTLDGYVSRLIDDFGACDRIRKTPLPFVYVVHLRRALIAYSITLPFAVIESFGWWTILVTFLVSYVFFGIDEIGVEIENPFGIDSNDLPLHTYCATVERDLFALMKDPAIASAGAGTEGESTEHALPAGIT